MNMVDAANGGALVNMTPQQAIDLISTMAANTQQFRANPEPLRRVHQLTKPARVCGICATSEHTTDACPSLNDDSMAHLDAVGNFPGPPQRRYDPYANTYNPGWRDHPNLKPNPRQHANAVTLQSGKVLEPIPGRNLGQEIAQKNSESDEQVRAKPPLPKIQPPFPGRLNQFRKSKEDKEIPETFRNVEINLPLLDAIRQIPRYAKFLKELCTNK
ncbi:hypothetical protein CXB51_022008 [Gossypium anomalum]|uniref:Retrotransposon gag protein n=1 Tax=Gossypium anomalum TaxID=47600 RepID=A0A8J5YMJ9_9ROSI|nr:hypothetical protein CXB51_022008 [Gossypium anomalum]